MDVDLKFPTLLKYAKTVQSDHAQNALKTMDTMRREGRFTDVILEAEGQQFSAHKAVLCSCSPYFDRMFQPGFVEQENKTVQLKDFDSTTLSTLLDFMYNSRITITEENAQDVLIGANLLLLQKVKDAAADVLIKLIDDSNVFSIRTLANMFVCAELELRANKYINDRFEFVSQSEDFKKLSLKDVMKLLNSQDLIVSSEESIFTSVQRWILHDKESRLSSFDELTSTVRYSLLSEQYLDNLIKNNQLVINSKRCKKNIEDVLNYKRGLKESGDLSVSLQSISQQYRRSNQLLFLQGTSTSTWFKIPPVLYDFEKSAWCTFKVTDPEAKHREDSTFVAHAGTIYCIEGQYQRYDEENGSTSIELSGQVYTLTLETRKMEKHSRLGIPRKRHQSVLLGDVCYVLGGSGSSSVPTNAVEYLDLSLPVLQGVGEDGVGREWKQGPSMLTKRVSHMAVELNGSIYIIGGWDGQVMVKTVEKFCPSSNLWETISEYADIRMKSGIAVMDGKIYLVGGCVQTLETCYKAEMFDPESRQWKQLPETHFARSNPVLSPYRGKLYVFGGEGNSYGQVECYDPVTNKWAVLSTTVKHFVNGFYSGCLIEKPWDFDVTNKDMPAFTDKVLSDVGLEAVRTWQTMWS